VKYLQVCLAELLDEGVCKQSVFLFPEVARTRLREETVQKQYRGFWQTLQRVHAKEGVRALYAGLPAQLVRQVNSFVVLVGKHY